MYNIYNETGKNLTLSTITGDNDGRSTVAPMYFRLGVEVKENEIQTFDITRVTDSVLFEMMDDFCKKGIDIKGSNKTTRFYFKGKDRKTPFYNPYEMTMNAVDTHNGPDEDVQAMKKSPRNCIILVLNNDSKFKVFHKTVSGHIPAKLIETDFGFKIAILFTRYADWSKSSTPSYIYVDGVDGKKQIRLGFTKTGPNKEYTTNVLFEEPFDGDKFPEDVEWKNRQKESKDSNQRPHKKPFRREYVKKDNTDWSKDHEAPVRKKSSEAIINKYDFNTFGDGTPVEGKQDTRRRKQKPHKGYNNRRDNWN